MRSRWSVALGLVVVVAFVAGLYAQDKEVTLKGNITCAKCELKVKGQDKCATVIVAKEGGKDVTYYFDKAAHKKWHADICKQGKEGSVTGKTSKEGDKMIVTVTKLEYK
jgi:Family of unknown function (DUF6370)